MPEYLRLDLFPATVTRGDSTEYGPVRAVVSEDTLYVFQDSSPAPELLFSELLYDFDYNSRNRYTAVTDDDRELITITKRAGCGCGNKLKGFRPFPGVPLKRSLK
jgi:hypothetical protein